LGGAKKSGLPCYDKPLFIVVLKLSHSATSLHGSVKSFCATTNLLTSSDSFQFNFKNKKACTFEEQASILKKYKYGF
jgi:hypothetical protein